jgi:hypothetical protein
VVVVVVVVVVAVVDLRSIGFWTTVLLFAEWLLFTLVSKLIHLIQNRKANPPTVFPMIEYLRTFLALYLFTFNNIMQTSLNILNCMEVPVGDTTANVVKNYPSVSCAASSYTPLFIASIVYLGLYAVVIPAALIRNLVALARGEGGHAITSEITKGMSLPYLGKWYQLPWELWRLTQRAALVAAAVFIADLNQ